LKTMISLFFISGIFIIYKFGLHKLSLTSRSYPKWRFSRV